MALQPGYLPYFLFPQIYSGKLKPTEHYVHIHCIYDFTPAEIEASKKEGKPKKGYTEYSESVLLSEFRTRWFNGLYDQCLKLNTSAKKPCNIYFGVAPRHDKGQDKASCSGSVIFYLDMDSHKGYTKEQRRNQIEYLKKINFAPSFVVDSGNGYHAYWILDKLYTKKGINHLEKEVYQAEIDIRKMIHSADCSEGGAVFNINRLLRLPGFLNVKNWSTGNTPACSFVYPTEPEIEQLIEKALKNDPSGLLPRYNPEQLALTFPACSLDEMNKFSNKATKLFFEPEKAAAAAAAMLVVENDVQKQTAAKIFANSEALKQQEEVLKKIVEPTLLIVPFVEMLKFPYKDSWMKTYIKKGYDGLTGEDAIKICKRYQIAELNASDLDSKIIYMLIEAKYTKQAIRNFWVHPENKLYRAEKETTSPDYFDTTYDNMLLMFKTYSIKSINGQHGEFEEAILVKENKTFFRKTDGSLTEILNFEFILKTTYEDLNAEHGKRETFEFEIKIHAPDTSNACLTYTLFLPRAAFQDSRQMKRFTYGRMCVFEDKSDLMQRVLNYTLIKYTNSPVKSFYSRMEYTNKTFLFPTMKITKDEIIAQDLGGLSNHYKNLLNVFTSEVKSKEEITAFLDENWKIFLSIHEKQLIYSILGILGAAAIKPIFEKELSTSKFNIPTLNIRSLYHTGKSETAELIRSIIGIKSIPGNTISSESSLVGLSITLNMFNFLPLMIDEFKETEGNTKKIQNLRDLIRRNYSGETQKKGRVDFSTTELTTHNAIIVIGEHALERVGHGSEITRVVPVQVGNSYDMSNQFNQKMFRQMQKLNWCIVGPHFFQFLLTLDPKQEFELFEKETEDCISRLDNQFNAEKMRLGHNISMLSYGAGLWDRFVNIHILKKTAKSSLNNIANELKTVLVKNLIDWSAREEQTYKLVLPEKESKEIIEEGKLVKIVEVNKTKIISHGEVIDFLSTITNIFEGQHPALKRIQETGQMLFEYQKERDTLILDFTLAYEIYVDYCRTQQLKPINNKVLLQNYCIHALEKDPWALSLPKPNKILNVTKKKCWEIKYSYLRNIGVLLDVSKQKTSMPLSGITGTLGIIP